MRTSHPKSLRPVFLLLSLALVLAVAAAFKPSIPVDQRNAILISWDGALREHVMAELAKGKLPNFARLIAHGSMVDIEVTGHQTDTKAGHAQMLTGYDPQVTGVHSNGNYRAVPAGYTIFERLHQAIGRTGFVTIMLTGKDHNLGSQGPGLLRPADPYNLSRSGITIWDGDQIRPASAVGKKAVDYVTQFARKGHFFLFVHLPDVDAAGHTYGESSEAYDRALQECDRWLGAILDELARTGADDRTLVYVTADHGFDVGTKQHAKASHVFLGTNDVGLHGGQQRDIVPTLLSAMGVDPTKITPPLPGKSLRP